MFLVYKIWVGNVISTLICILAEGDWFDLFRSTFSSCFLAARFCAKEHEILILTTGHSEDVKLATEEFFDDKVLVRIYEIQKIGLYKTINYGVGVASGSWISYVHIGDKISENFYQYMHLAVSQNPGKIPVCDVEFISDLGVLWRRSVPLILMNIQRHKNLILHPNALYPKEFELSNPYETDRASDHRHINALLDSYKIVRVRNCAYRFNIGIPGLTADFTRSTQSIRLIDRLLSFYVFLFESNKCSRLKSRFLAGKRSWN